MFANQYVENDALAADIVQECFVKLWQLRDDFMYVHQIKSFLYTSVRNKSLNELEHTKVMNEYAQKVQEIGKEYSKSVAQVALRYLIQRDIIVIPKSTHKERMIENFNVFDFSLNTG